MNDLDHRIKDKLEHLPWGQKLYLIEKFNLNLNVASCLFNSNPGVIVDMKAQAALGYIRIVEVDGEPYRKTFQSLDGKYPPLKKARTVSKDSKLTNFFDEISNQQQPVEPLLKKYNLKWNTIKQHNRFDTFPERGKIKCKKVTLEQGEPKQHVIWRESP